jgi:hypothetical protein
VVHLALAVAVDDQRNRLGELEPLSAVNGWPSRSKLTTRTDPSGPGPASPLRAIVVMREFGKTPT